MSKIMKALLASSLTIFISNANATDPATAAASICNAGVCAPIDPVTAVLFIGATALADELNKGDKAFGPNHIVVKTLETVKNDLEQGPGPNNTIVKTLNNINNDLTNGPGPNNTVVRAIEDLKKFKIKW